MDRKVKRLNLPEAPPLSTPGRPGFDLNHTYQKVGGGNGQS
ncbi:MAG TPA: hypothetical protein VH415_02565 [Nitrososphaeraceae archaeon]